MAPSQAEKGWHSVQVWPVGRVARKTYASPADGDGDNRRVASAAADTADAVGPYVGRVPYHMYSCRWWVLPLPHGWTLPQPWNQKSWPAVM